MMAFSMITDNWLARHGVPVHNTVLVKDLIVYKKGIAHMVSMDDDKKRKKTVTLYGILS